MASFDKLQLEKFVGYTLGRDNEVIASMLQFADDTLIFGKAMMQNSLTIKCIMRCFEMTSGLKINFHKSKLARIKVGERTSQILASLLHCKVMQLPFTYLGLPMGEIREGLNFGIL